MRHPDFLSLYRCKLPYNSSDILIDILASVRQENLDRLAITFCLKIAGHERYSKLEGEQIAQFDDLIRPFVMASQMQRKLLVQNRVPPRQRVTK